MKTLFGETRYRPAFRDFHIGWIPFEQAYRIWLHPYRIKQIDSLRLSFLKSKEKDFYLYHHLNQASLTVSVTFWRECIKGTYQVRAMKMRAGVPDAYEMLTPEQVKELWPRGFWNKNPDYDQVELLGPMPSWIRATVDYRDTIQEVTAPEFQYLDDYSFVIMRGHMFDLGPLQAGVVRYLHHSSGDYQNWRSENDIRDEIGCGVISDLFKSHPNWQELIQKCGRARYRLNIEKAKLQQMIIIQDSQLPP